MPQAKLNKIAQMYHAASKPKPVDAPEDTADTSDRSPASDNSNGTDAPSKKGKVAKKLDFDGPEDGLTTTTMDMRKK